MFTVPDKVLLNENFSGLRVRPKPFLHSRHATGNCGNPSFLSEHSCHDLPHIEVPP